MSFFDRLLSYWNRIAAEPDDKPAADGIPQASEAKAMTLEQALAVFDTLADMEDIAFGYPADGCAARTHIMGRRLMAAGWEPGKAWAFEQPLQSLWTTDQATGEKIEWWYHVAPTADVSMPDGSIRSLVFDPGLFDGPVTAEEWSDLIHAVPNNVELARWGEPPPRHGGGDYSPMRSTDESTDHLAQNVMVRYVPEQPAGKRVVYHSIVRHELAAPPLSGTVPDMAGAFHETSGGEPPPDRVEGQTWVSRAREGKDEHSAARPDRQPESVSHPLSA